MTAYIIAIRNSTSDADAVAAYRAAAGKVPRVEGMKALAAYGRYEALEGPPTEGVVLLEFPDFAAARTWYDSPEYQRAREHRLAGSDYRFILFEGV